MLEIVNITPEFAIGPQPSAEDFEALREDLQRLRNYSVNRADDDFWEHYDWLQARFNSDKPVEAGLFDLNRYYYKAF